MTRLFLCLGVLICLALAPLVLLIFALRRAGYAWHNWRDEVHRG